MVFKLSSHLRNEGVDFEVGPLVQLVFTHGTLWQIGTLPVSLDAVTTEVVPAWSGDRLVKHIQTDGAKELLLGQNAGGCSHIWEHIQNEENRWDFMEYIASASFILGFLLFYKA